MDKSFADETDEIRNAWGFVYDVENEVPPFYLTDAKGTFWLSRLGNLYQRNNAPFVDHILNHKLFKIKQEPLEDGTDITITIEPTDGAEIYVNNSLLTKKAEIRNGGCRITCTEFENALRFEAFVDVTEYPELASIGLNYRYINLLGKGGFAVVFKGLSVNDETFCAIKTGRYVDKNPQLAREESFLANLHHVNIAKCMDFIEVGSDQFLITGFVGGGSLEFRIKSRGVLSESNAKRIFLQLFSAFSYLHIRKILHRDLKPPNICMTDADDFTTTPKVIDFGLACYSNDPNAMRSIVGSYKTMAPEVLTKKVKKTQAPYTEKVDVWGLGVCLFFSLNRCLPMVFNEDLKTYRNNVMKGRSNYKYLESYSKLSKETKFVIDSCMEVKEIKRPTVWTLIKYPWNVPDEKPRPSKSKIDTSKKTP